MERHQLFRLVSFLFVMFIREETKFKIKMQIRYFYDPRLKSYINQSSGMKTYMIEVYAKEGNKIVYVNTFTDVDYRKLLDEVQLFVYETNNQFRSHEGWFKRIFTKQSTFEEELKIIHRMIGD